MQIVRRWLWLLFPVVALGWVIGCGRQGNLPPSRPRPAEPQLNLEGLKYLAQAEPADAKSVIDLRKDAKDGDDVIIVGRVGGSKHPVVSGRAAFTIVDLSLKSCDDDPNCYDFA
jgi:hypothetical protein